MDFKKFILPHIYDLKPYSSARDEFKGKEGYFLDANENPFDNLNTGYNRYPDPLQLELKQRIAEIKEVKTENIFLGNGSDEAIDLLIRMTCASGKGNIVLFPPTYGMYEVSANINDAKIIKIPLIENFQINIDKLFSSISDQTRLIFICSPNNPTGNKINRKDIYKVLDNFKTGFIIIDEAYIDFNDEPSFIQELNKYPNLIVMQTLSKAYGLASLRLGMAFAHSEIIEILNKIKPPYNISGANQKYALETLSNLDLIGQNLQEINLNKEDLIKYLEKNQFVDKIYPSNANFILVKFQKSKELFNFLIQNKIITRYRGNVSLCDNTIRISIGTKEENNALIKDIEKFYSI